jgi:hypothetical protein
MKFLSWKTNFCQWNHIFIKETYIPRCPETPLTSSGLYAGESCIAYKATHEECEIDAVTLKMLAALDPWTAAQSIGTPSSQLDPASVAHECAPEENARPLLPAGRSVAPP